MALIPNTAFPGKTAGPTANYPQGEARDITVPGDNTGTPFNQTLLNDLFGMQQALIGESGITPSGSPDTALVSQYVEAMRQLFGGTFTNRTVLASNAKVTVGMMVLTQGETAANDGSGAYYRVVPAGTGVVDGINYVDLPNADGGSGLQIELLRSDALRVIAAGGATTSRSLASWAGHVLTPEDFGAVGDGVTDDTAAVQSFLDVSGSVLVELTRGKTYLCGLLTLPSGTGIKGNGATLKCDGTAGDWITASFPQAGGTITNTVFDYDSNTNGGHMLKLDLNAAGWNVFDCDFLNMHTRAAIRAEYITAISGDGFLHFRGCNFSGGTAAGAFAIYAQNPNLGVDSIWIDDCRMTDLGGSIMLFGMVDQSVNETTGRFGAFKNCRVTNCCVVGNGTGTFGAIPMELWGHDNLVVSNCVVDDATRGIGFAWGRNVSCTDNTIMNQTIYAHEISIMDGITFSGETTLNCFRYLADTYEVTTAVGRESNNVSIVGNTIKDTGATALTYVANVYAVTGAVIVNVTRRNWLIADNNFINMRNIDGVVRIDKSENLTVSGNTYNSEFDDDAIILANLSNSNRSVIKDNEWHRLQNFSALHQTTNDFIVKPGSSALNPTVKNNTFTHIGLDTGGDLGGIGDFAAPAAHVNVTVMGNKIVGNFWRGVSIDDTSDTARVLDNDVTRGVFSDAAYVLNAATVHRQKITIYSGTAIPTVGTFTRGDIMWNESAAALGTPGWVCTVSGTPGTWVAMASLV